MLTNSFKIFNQLRDNKQIFPAQSMRKKLFANQMKTLRREQVLSMVRCKLCTGLFRFAHTLIQCGHTFCQQCIFQHIGSFKGKHPKVFCPQCNSPIEQSYPPYQRSIIKDVFKQNLADFFSNAGLDQDKIILTRVQKLFPEFNLDFLYEEFNYSIQQKKKKIKRQKNHLMTKLPIIVKQKLGIQFEALPQLLLNDQSFKQLQKKLKVTTAKQSSVLDFRPRTERDFTFVGIKHKIKVPFMEVQKIRKFLQKNLLKKLQGSQQLSRQLINPQKDNLDVHIQLYLGDRKLGDEDLSLLPQLLTQPIYYTLRNL